MTIYPKSLALRGFTFGVIAMATSGYIVPEVPVTPPPIFISHGGINYSTHISQLEKLRLQQRQIREDEDILVIIMAALNSGLLT